MSADIKLYISRPMLTRTMTGLILSSSLIILAMLDVWKIHPLSVHISYTGEPGAYARELKVRGRDTLDRGPDHHRAHSHTPPHTTDNF